jgi:CysZ protein
MAAIPGDNPVSNFSRGFFYPFRGLRLIAANPSLLRYVAIPFLINLIVFSLSIYLGLGFFNHTVVEQIPQGDAWYWVILFYAAWVVAILLTAVLVFFAFTVVGNLIASPFNELLSERAEEILTGHRDEEPFSLKGFAADARRIMAVEVKKLSLFVLGMAALLLLNFIPALGQLLYSITAALFTLFFLVMEYLGYVFERKKFAFAAQRRYIFRRKFLMLGFGTGVFCILAIPFLQFLCLPLAVLGATKLWCDGPSDTSTGSSIQ